MSDMDRLRQVIETNFRLNALQTRELSGQVDRKMSKVSGELRVMSAGLNNVSSGLHDVSAGLKALGAKVEGLGSEVEGLGSEVQGLGQTFKSSMHQQLDRDQETLTALREILDNSVDLHKTAADHERRIRKLEERAS